MPAFNEIIRKMADNKEAKEKMLRKEELFKEHMRQKYENWIEEEDLYEETRKPLSEEDMKMVENKKKRFVKIFLSLLVILSALVWYLVWDYPEARIYVLYAFT